MNNTTNHEPVISVKVEVDTSQIDAAIEKAKELAAILKDCGEPVPEKH